MKIYLAKSNQANPEDYIKTKNMILSKGIDVVEYSGGKYSNKELLECDVLVVIPNLNKAKSKVKQLVINGGLEKRLEIILGMGLTQQIEVFPRKKFIILDTVNFLSSEINLKKLEIIDAYDDNFVEYSKYIIDDYSLSNIRNLLDGFIRFKKYQIPAIPKPLLDPIDKIIADNGIL
jgi:hypothetical protein